MFKYKGFTLIELLIVVAIIGVLAAAITVSVGNQQRNARDARRKTDMETLRDAINKQDYETSTVPLAIGTSASGCTTNIVGNCPFSNSSVTTGITSWTTLIPVSIIASIPTDPLQGQTRTHVIRASSGGAISTSTTNAFRYGYALGGYDPDQQIWAWKLSTLMERDSAAVSGDGGNDSVVVAGSAAPSSAHCFEIIVGGNTTYGGGTMVINTAPAPNALRCAAVR